MGDTFEAQLASAFGSACSVFWPELDGQKSHELVDGGEATLGGVAVDLFDPRSRASSLNHAAVLYLILYLLLQSRNKREFRKANIYEYTE